MSLLDEALETFTRILVTETDDGYGSKVAEYTDGDKIQCVATIDRSQIRREAEKDTDRSDYVLTTRKNVVLMFNELVKRDRDGKVFRVVSDGDDSRTPVSAWLNMRTVRAVEWRV